MDIVTIDGPSGSGKSTISRLLAEAIGYTYLDTGAMYRAVALKAQRLRIDPEDDAGLREVLAGLDLQLRPGGKDTLVFLDNEDVSLAIRTPEMSLAASRISALPVVREKLTALQRAIGRNGKIVAEGRDMGTVVFPAARHKFFLDAEPEERARRRCLQLEEQGMKADYEEIVAQIRERDHNDSSRALAPLKPASDAIIINSSRIPPGEVVARMKEKVVAH